MMSAPSVTLLAAVMTLLASTARAQTADLYDRARDALSAGDTTAALEHLRRLTEERPDHAEGWALLGLVHARRASGVANDFEERREAERALDRAWELDREHPRYLLARGLLMRKQQVYLRARQMLDGAIERLERDPGALPAAERAELWYRRGLFYEDEYLDTRHLVWAPELPVSSVCPVPTFCANFENPKDFNPHLERAADLSGFGEDDYEQMAESFREALRADPGHAAAFHRLAIHWIDRRDLAAALQLARTYQNHASRSPWGYLVEGLARFQLGQDSAAEAAFEHGLARAPPELLAHYRDVSILLREDAAEVYSDANQAARQHLEEVLWQKSEPLYLTPTNEIRLAHLARRVYADLMFDDPSVAAYGSETERGHIYVRYGAPQRIWQVRRDRSREGDGVEAHAALEAATDPEGTTNPLDYTVREISDKGGGRWIFWNYGAALPNFIFGKQLRWRRTSHLLSSYSKTAADDMRESLPPTYSTNFTIHPYPAQLARFKGQEPGIVDLDVYSEVPGDSMAARVQPDSLTAGLFVFTGPEHRLVYERRLRLDGRPEPRALTYTLPLLEGEFILSVEARNPAGPAATRRDTITVRPYPEDRLALSDLVLAHEVRLRAEHPTDRRAFTLRVNRRLQFEPGDPLALYWELYGLTPGEDGLARYRVSVTVRDAEGKSVLASVVGALGNLVGLGDDPEPELRYDRLAEIEGDRVLEYVSLQLGAREPGRYRVRVQILDRLSGETAGIEREFEIAAG